jgi:hypothetical protein
MSNNCKEIVLYEKRKNIARYLASAAPERTHVVSRTLNKSGVSDVKRGKSVVKSGKHTDARLLEDDDDTYNGPIIDPMARMQNTRCEVLMSYEAPVSSTVGGVFAPSWGLQNPSSTGNWSVLAAAFDEYRVLASEVMYNPINKYSTSSTKNPLYMCIDRDSTGALTSVGAATAYESVQTKQLDVSWNMKWRMASPNEALWLTTASPANRGAFLGYVSGLSISTAYGQIIQYFLVQFRAMS